MLLFLGSDLGILPLKTPGRMFAKDRNADTGQPQRVWTSPLALHVTLAHLFLPPGPQVCRDPDGRTGSYKDGHLLGAGFTPSAACPDSILKVPGQPSQ